MIKKLSILIILFFSIKTYSLNKDEAIHLTRRTHFHLDVDSYKEIKKLNRSQAIDYLLARVNTKKKTSEPKWFLEYKQIRNHFMSIRKNKISKEVYQDVLNSIDIILSDLDIRPKLKKKIKNLASKKKTLKKAINVLNNKALRWAIQKWWYQEMITTTSPFTELMVLFWHDFFATGYGKVKDPVLMMNQNDLLRQNAFGNFGHLLMGIAKDPAMLIYLDGNKNTKKSPNENFAREVLELFSLGEGHYSETDIREAAKAFAGWGIDRKEGIYRVKRKQVDNSIKNFRGFSGNLNGSDIIEILSKEKQTANYVTKKFLEYFVMIDPPKEYLAKVSNDFYSSGLEIKTLIRSAFNTDYFFQAKGTLIKSPVELIICIIKEFGLEGINWQRISTITKRLGQSVFSPPNVSGWKEGTHWINSATLLTRKDFISRFINNYFYINKKKAKKVNNKVMNSESIDMNTLEQLLKDNGLHWNEYLLTAQGNFDEKERITLIEKILLSPHYQMR